MKLSQLARDLHGTLCPQPNGPEPFFDTLAEDFVDSLAVGLVGFPVGSFSRLAEVVGRPVAVVVGCLPLVLSC